MGIVRQLGCNICGKECPCQISAGLASLIEEEPDLAQRDRGLYPGREVRDRIAPIAWRQQHQLRDEAKLIACRGKRRSLLET